MKRVYYILLCVLALCVGCQKEPFTPEGVNAEGFGARMSSDAGTRVRFEFDDRHTYTHLWESGDAISIFEKSDEARTNYNYASDEVTGGGVYAHFKYGDQTYSSTYDKSASGWNYATYPYSASNTCSASGSGATLTVIVPPAQTYRAGSYAKDAAPLVAASQNEQLNFRNVCGYLKINLSATSGAEASLKSVSKIVFSGNSSEGICGSGTATFSSGNLSSVSAGSGQSITLTIPGNMTLTESSQSVYIALFPTTFNNGFRADIYNADNDVIMSCKTASGRSLQVQRNKVLAMEVVEMGSGYYDLVPVTSANSIVSDSLYVIKCGNYYLYDKGSNKMGVTTTAISDTTDTSPYLWKFSGSGSSFSIKNASSGYYIHVAYLGTTDVDDCYKSSSDNITLSFSGGATSFYLGSYIGLGIAGRRYLMLSGSSLTRGTTQTYWSLYKRIYVKNTYHHDSAAPISWEPQAIDD